MERKCAEGRLVRGSHLSQNVAVKVMRLSLRQVCSGETMLSGVWREETRRGEDRESPAPALAAKKQGKEFFD
jgi:hypothetical protein